MVGELGESSWGSWGVRASGCAVRGVQHLGVSGMCMCPGTRTLGDVPWSTTQNALCRSATSSVGCGKNFATYR